MTPETVVPFIKPKPKTIKWYEGQRGLYSKTRRGQEFFYGKVWVRSERRIRTFSLGTDYDKAVRKLAVIQDDPEKAVEKRKPKAKPVAPIRFGAMVDRFLAEYHSRGDSGFYGHVAESWREFFGNVPAASILRPRVEAYREHLRREEYGDSSIRKYVGALGTLFRWAAECCDPPLVTAIPTRGVKRPSEPDREVEVLWADEEKALLEKSSETLRPLVEFCIASGLRKGEALTLTWPQIDRASGNVLIHKSKTGRARAVPLTPTLTGILSRVTKQADSPLVFLNTEGRPWKARAASRSLERALTRAGIRKRLDDGGDEYQGVFNLLRHTFGSRKAAAGVPYGVIAKLMGNSARVCEKHYVRFAPSDLKAAMLAQAPAPVTGAPSGDSMDRMTPTPIHVVPEVVTGQ